ncbi:MAG TPA: hypothetical protein VFW71_02140 [Actinomycetota bacterium]|nr:hypothetical protein [Actinomycetota bacterium]
MPSQDEEQIRQDAEKAKAYFSKMPGFESSATGRPPMPQSPAVPAAPAAPEKAEPPLSEAEKSWKKLLG